MADWLRLQLRSKEFREAFFRDWLNQEFFAKAEELMSKDGVTRAELARRLGKSRTLVSRWFRGTSNPCLYTLADIARCLGYRVDVQLVPDEGAKP